MRSPERVTPFYFGAHPNLLFGCLHEPRSARQSDWAFVICQPVGHEYVASHRALRQLATRLSDAGYAVLRFDYFGCGDSHGDMEQASISQWLADVAAAIAEIRRRNGAKRVCLIGLRLGAALSMMSSATNDVDSLVLWDPVTVGTKYLSELRDLQAQMLQFRRKRKPTRDDDDTLDILGFPFTKELQSDLEQINLKAWKSLHRGDTLMVSTVGHSETSALTTCLAGVNARVECQQFDTFKVWLPTTDGSLPVPSQLLQSIVDWARKNCS